MWILSQDVHDKVQPQKAQPNSHIKLFWYHKWQLNKKNPFQSWSLVLIFLVLGVKIYFQKSLLPETQNLSIISEKSHLSSVACLISCVTCYDIYFVHFLEFLVFFLQCLLLKAERQIKALLSLQYGLRWMKHVPQIEVVAQGRIYYLGFGFFSCSCKQKNHKFRLIQACDAIPCNLKKAQKNYPKTFGFGLDPSSPILDNLQK